MDFFHSNNIYSNSRLDVCSCVWICAPEEDGSVSLRGEKIAKKQEASVNDR